MSNEGDQGPGRPEPAPPRRRLGLAELTREADVSVRTVRYYIAEGLLPPPVGAGPRSAYTPAHLERLRLIARFKAAYLPLREIRRRLAGLDDEDVRRLLDAEATVSSDGLEAIPKRERDSARWPPAPRPPSRPEAPPVGFSFSASAAGFDVPPARDEPSAPRPMLGLAYPASFPPDDWADDDEAEPLSEPDAWRRVPLGDDAELLIRESSYHRRRDRIDWLVRWARKVFG